MFASLDSSLNAIATELGIKGASQMLVPPLSEQNENCVKWLLWKQPNRAAVMGGWSAQSLVWRDISGVDLKSVNDWFSFLEIPRKDG